MGDKIPKLHDKRRIRHISITATQAVASLNLPSTSTPFPSCLHTEPTLHSRSTATRSTPAQALTRLPSTSVDRRHNLSISNLTVTDIMDKRITDKRITIVIMEDRKEVQTWETPARYLLRYHEQAQSPTRLPIRPTGRSYIIRTSASVSTYIVDLEAD